MQRPTAFNVMVKPTGPVCNLNCTYCYYLDKKKLYPGRNDFKLPEDLLEKFIKEYIEAQQVPVVTFVWQGGEPTLLGIEYFKKIVEIQKKYSAGKNIENAFQTNGTRLDDDWCKFFTDNKILVGISIDGEEHNHDRFRKTNSGGPTFKKVMKGIELLHRHKVEFNTLSVVNSYNVHYGTETYRFLKKIGSGFMQFLPAVERIGDISGDDRPSVVSPVYNQKAVVTDWSVGARDYGKFLISIFNEWVRNDVARYYVQIFDATLANFVGEMPGVCIFSETCGDALAMEHNGDIFSCDHYVFPEYFLGNINDKSLAAMATSQEQFDFGVSKRNSLPSFCLRCEVRYACHGECPKHRIINTPDGKPGLNYLCEGYKMFFKHAEPYMEFMAKELKAKRAPANVMQWLRNKENIVVKPSMPNRNDPCPCGSGKKFKNCCAGSPLYKV
ncbi:MAG TPA: anaerobic sulfatase-maturation protein [Bacteroidales bacterium]|nr:anaerobic sulfatase-maturation protein [Bacteroidales bacterium]